jgi:hypothetical protein
MVKEVVYNTWLVRLILHHSLVCNFGYLHMITEHRGQVVNTSAPKYEAEVVNTSASYLGDPRLRTWPGDLLS